MKHIVTSAGIDLSDHPDVLTKKVAEIDAWIRNLRCPACQGDQISKVVDPYRPFLPGAMLPNWSAKCADCGVTFGMHTGVIASVS